MSTIKDDLDRFTQFASADLSGDHEELSLEEIFDLWRADNPTNQEYAENVAAITAAIEDFQKGDRGTPAGEHSQALLREFVN